MALKLRRSPQPSDTLSTMHTLASRTEAPADDNPSARRTRRQRRSQMPTAAWAAALCGAFASVACAGGAEVSQPPDVPAPPPPPPPDPLQDELFKVGQLRKLTVLREVKLEKLQRSQLATEVERYVARETPQNMIEGQGALLRLLGVVPPDFDYLASSAALMQAQLAGFYDPGRGTMFLAADLSLEEQRATLLHELIHALQDQHFNLGKLLEPGVLSGDKTAALHTLAEGDATSAMLEAVLKDQGYDMGQLSDDMLADRMRQSFETQNPEIPSILKRAALVPYVDGLLFVNELRRSGGWKLVDDAWADPPASTEQLLHPEKYAAREPWRQFAAPPLPRPECTPIYEDVIGEQGLKILYEEWVPQADAEAAAEGWNGDHLSIYRCGQDYALFWRVAHDDASEGARALEAFRAGIPHCRPAVDQVARTVRQLKDHLVVVALQGATATCADLTTWIDAGGS